MGNNIHCFKFSFRSIKPAGRSPSPPGKRTPDTLWGGEGGVARQAEPRLLNFPARTAASDGHTAFTRAARSASIRFAVIPLSGTMDVGRDHLIHRKRSPFPYEGKALTRRKVGETFPAERYTSPFCKISHRRKRSSKGSRFAGHSSMGFAPPVLVKGSAHPRSSVCTSSPAEQSPFSTRHGFASPQGEGLKRGLREGTPPIARRLG